MHADNRWLAEALGDVPGLDLRANNNVHFQSAFCEHAQRLAEIMRSHGIGVRVSEPGPRVFPDALRIVAPIADERDRFAAALNDVA
jgi:histidinol-phosphate/aromatic aminotransferase/cobyric acid decarboxylase-like protein